MEIKEFSERKVPHIELTFSKPNDEFKRSITYSPSTGEFLVLFKEKRVIIYDMESLLIFLTYQINIDAVNYDILKISLFLEKN